MKTIKNISYFFLILLISTPVFFLSKAILDKELSHIEIIVNIFIIFISLLMSVLIHTIAHELGHVIFGKLTGYKFIAMRIGSILFTKNGRKLHIQKVKVKGTLGQSIMMPKSHNYREQAYVLYSFGGTIVNILLSLLLVSVIIISNPISYMKIFILTCSFIGFIYAFNNGIPRITNGLLSDGYMVFIQKKSETARKSVFTQLKIYAYLSEGLTFSQIPKGLFEPININNIDLNNTLYLSNILNTCSLLVENKKFKKVEEIYQHLFDNMDKSNRLFFNEIQCELLFTRIMNNSQNIDELCTDSLKQYIKFTNSYMSRKRLMFAFYLIYKGQVKEANDIYKKALESYKTYFPKGEAESEWELINYIKEYSKKLNV